MDTSRSAVPGVEATNGLKVLQFNDPRLQTYLEDAEKRMAPGTAYVEFVVPNFDKPGEYHIAVGAKAKLINGGVMVTAQGVYAHAPGNNAFAGKITANF